jgi:hypothetical protein
LVPNESSTRHRMQQGIPKVVLDVWIIEVPQRFSMKISLIPAQ